VVDAEEHGAGDEGLNVVSRLHAQLLDLDDARNARHRVDHVVRQHHHLLSEERRCVTIRNAPARACAA
jgi:hypothetical protein